VSGIVEERRAARAGTVSGLALLVGATALIAATRGAHSIFAASLLCLLSAGLAHALLDEIRRQARRRSAGWAVADTVNAVLLAGWSVGAATTAALVAAPVTVRVVTLTLACGYALSCGYFIAERRRTVRSSGGTATASSSAAQAGTQASAIGSGPEPSSGPSTGSPSSTETTKTDVMPDGYGMSSR
jgi:hypothetical protein